jgi:hypothetical protein
MSRTQQVLLIAAALLAAQAGAAKASTIDYTLPSTDSAGFTTSFTMPISPSIADVTQLLSVTGTASVTAPEFGTFTITADFSDSTTYQLFSALITSPDEMFSLPSLSYNGPFPADTIDGITFADTSGISYQFDAGTVFAFNQQVPSSVPEPVSAALLGSGIAAAAWLRRRRQGDGTS